MLKWELLDYKNCIANLPNSILKNFGVETNGDTLGIFDKYLEKGYKNVVVLLLDGMGTHILESNLPEDSFLRKHFVKTYNSVFPPTTVAATTSIDCGLTPIEHSWFGWDCYYPQIDKNVTVFLNTEQGTSNSVSDESVARKYCGYESIYHKLISAGKKAYYATPFIPPHPNSFESICDLIKDLCKQDDKKYIYAYWDQPDSIMHQFGCKSDEAKDMLKELDNKVRSLCSELKDTLLVVTADHGHIDGRNKCILDYPQVLECLIRLPSIEPRALNLFVKEGKEEVFEEEFTKAFGEDFILLTKREVFESNLFGAGNVHENALEMIGDYVAIAKTDLTIFNTYEETSGFKGVHAGYTKDEIEIPFIVYEAE